MSQAARKVKQRGLAGLPFAHARTFGRGEFVLHADAPAEAVYLIRRGHVRCFLLDSDGRETTTAVVGPGQIVGIAAFGGRATYYAFAQALTTVDTWLLPAAEVRRRLPATPALQGLVLGCLTQRFELALALLRGVCLLSVPERIRDIQLRLSACLGSDQRSVRQTTLAALLQIRPETLARAQPLLPDTVAGRVHTDQQASIGPGRRAFRIDEVVIDGALPDGCVGLVISGQLQLSLAGEGSRSILVDAVEAGDLFGAGTLLGLPPVGLRLVGTSSGEIEVLQASAVLDRLTAGSASCGELVTRCAQRLERLERGLARAALPDVHERLMQVLREIVLSEGLPDSAGARLVPSRWSHAALARDMGVCRETVTRGLATLAQAGAIERQGRHILVLRADQSDADHLTSDVHPQTHSAESGRRTPGVASPRVDHVRPHATRTPSSLTLDSVRPTTTGSGHPGRMAMATATRREAKCRLCGLRTSGLLCSGCADRLELDLQQNRGHACPECGRHRELCQLVPCNVASSSGSARPPERPAVVWLPVADIDEPSRTRNSRRAYPEGSIKELSASLRQDGFLQPLCVRPHGPRYELVFGVRRFRAALQAGLLDVPCTIRTADDDRAFLLNAIENLHREQLSNAERVAAIERLAATGLGVREIGRRTGFNPSTISRWLRINRRPALKEALEEGRIDIARAVTLVEAPKSALRDLIAAAPNMPAAELRRQVMSVRNRGRVSADDDDENRRHLNEALRCLRAVRCTHEVQLIDSIRHELERLSSAASQPSFFRQLG
jgi:ParB/RepB/Spo0J family partition protein